MLTTRHPKVGTRFWRIACLILHYVYSSRDARDGLHHQRQALLRNSSNPESAIGTILFLLHSWRGSGVAGAWAPLVRLLVVLALAALSVGGFAVASGFSSQISVGISDEVLISGANCMNINQTAFFALNTTELGIYFKPFLNRQREGAAAYAKQCYKPDAPGALGCGTFVRTKVSSEVRTDAPCPFDDSLCKLKNGNLIIDTGLLDSHGDLGINAPAGERLQFRRRMHCGPLVTEGFKTIRNTTQGRSFTRYHYGRTLSFDLESSVNFTFEVSNDWLADLKDEEGGRDSGDFELGYALSCSGAALSISSLTVNHAPQGQASIRLQRLHRRNLHAQADPGALGPLRRSLPHLPGPRHGPVQRRDRRPVVQRHHAGRQGHHD